MEKQQQKQDDKLKAKQKCFKQEAVLSLPCQVLPVAKDKKDR